MPFFGTEQQYISECNISAFLLLEKSTSKSNVDYIKTNSMKNLEIYGVQEMDTTEMKKTDGGLIWLVYLAIAYIVVEAAINPQAHVDAFNEGWEMG